MVVRLTVAALALAVALAFPVRLSADAWAYAAYGALVTHGVDPYARAFRSADLAELHDPLLDRALPAWDGSIPRDVYGPLFTLPCAAVVAATRPFGPGVSVFALRLLASLALLACIALAGRTRPRLASLLAYHPVVLWSAAEGHNDSWWLALVLLAGWGRGRRSRLALLIAAAAVKAVAVVALAWDVVQNRRGRTRGAIAFAALALAYAPLAWSVLAHGLDHAPGPPRVSLLHAGALAAYAGSVVPLMVAAALGCVAILAFTRAFRGGDVLAGAALLAWTALPAPEPWYAVWLVPAIARSPATPAGRGLLAASVTGVAGYLQDLSGGTALHDPALLGGIMLAQYALPLLIAALSPASGAQPLQAPPTPPAPATATATAVASASPLPAETATPNPTPTPAASSSPSASPNPYLYVVTPTAPPNGVTTRIIEVALNDKVLHSGGMMLVRVTTSPDVTTVVARTMGHEIAVPLYSPGVFAGQQQMPSGIPFFLLNRTFQVDFVATTADGHTAVTSLPLRLER
ncbi:MAG: hypothetical protein JWO85_3343 [Candidatus Eremiobacteraeota bacterium]|nr:hypothetical protein [Candidatus Eremiobacteraeota bacterium]